MALGDYADQDPPPFDAFAAAGRDRRPDAPSSPSAAGSHSVAEPKPYVPAPAIPPMPPGAIQEPPAEEAPSRSGGLLGRARNPFSRRKTGRDPEQSPADGPAPTWPGRTDLSPDVPAHSREPLPGRGTVPYETTEPDTAPAPFARTPAGSPRDPGAMPRDSAGLSRDLRDPAAPAREPRDPAPFARQPLPDVPPLARDPQPTRDPQPVRDPFQGVPPHARGQFRDDRPPVRSPLLPTDRPSSRAPLVPEPHAVSSPLPQPDPITPPLPVTPAPEPDDRRGRKKRKDDDYVDWVSGLGGE